jgi:hypothetical protein
MMIVRRLAFAWLGSLVLLAGCVGELSADEQAQERWTASVRTLPVPFYTQQPNAKACTAAVLAMGLGSYGVTTLEDASRSPLGAQPVYAWFVAQGYVDKTTQYVDSNKIFEAAETLSAKQVLAEAVWWEEESVEAVRNAIDAGSPAILFTHHNQLPGSGISTAEHHAVLAYGYSGDVFYYYNPWRSKIDDARFSIRSADLLKALLGKVIVRFSSPRGPLFGWDYCSVDHPCSAGQGDCDSDKECQVGLICAQDVGARYGADPIVDVCERPASAAPAPSPSWSCSKSSHGGQQIWTCSGGSRYRCEANVPKVEVCPTACVSNPPGIDDTCR